MEKENLMEKQTTNKRCLLFGLETRELEIDGEEKKELWVEGRAVSFNSPTVLLKLEKHNTKSRSIQGLLKKQTCQMSFLITITAARFLPEPEIKRWLWM